jgi:hypothetical protein
MRAIIPAVGLAVALVFTAFTAMPRSARAVPASVAQSRLEGPFELRSRIYPGTVRRYWVHGTAS